MDKERLHEVAYLLLKEDLRTKGILGGGCFISQLSFDDAARAGIQREELSEFVILMTKEVVAEGPR